MRFVVCALVLVRWCTSVWERLSMNVRKFVRARMGSLMRSLECGDEFVGEFVGVNLNGCAILCTLRGHQARGEERSEGVSVESD